MSYRHIIITRFNLQYESSSDIHLQPEWLEQRFLLFETYCLPSIQNQTCQDFKWIILCSEQTPAIYQSRLQHYATTYPNIALHFCPYYEDVNQLYHIIGKQYCTASYLLSTRMDSDDMIANDFVEHLQQSIIQRHLQPAIYTFPSGIQCFLQEHKAFAVVDKKNHFLNYLEPNSSIHTCLGRDHTKVPNNQLIILTHKNMWCEIVHQHNICNGYLPHYRYHLPLHTSKYPILFDEKRTFHTTLFLLQKHLQFRSKQIQRVIYRLFGNRNS